MEKQNRAERRRNKFGGGRSTAHGGWPTIRPNPVFGADPADAAAADAAAAGPAPDPAAATEPSAKPAAGRSAKPAAKPAAVARDGDGAARGGTTKG